MKVLRTLALAVSTAALLATAACGGDDNSLEGSDDTTGAEPTGSTEKGALTISGQDFTEMQIMAAMYQQVLEADGYDVTVKLVQTRDIYVKGLGKGEIDVVPEYLAGITDFLNTEANGDGAESVSTNDPTETLTALEPLAAAKGISMLEPSAATDQNAFFVTQDFAAGLQGAVRLRRRADEGLRPQHHRDHPHRFWWGSDPRLGEERRVAAGRDGDDRRKPVGPGLGTARGRQGHSAGPEPHPRGQL
jgi:osmoprotectant transport system substrate-binding protein